VSEGACVTDSVGVSGRQGVDATNCVSGSGGNTHASGVSEGACVTEETCVSERELRYR